MKYTLYSKNNIKEIIDLCNKYEEGNEELSGDLKRTIGIKCYVLANEMHDSGDFDYSVIVVECVRMLHEGEFNKVLIDLIKTKMTGLLNKTQ